MIWFLMSIIWIGAPADTLTLQQGYEQVKTHHPLHATFESQDKISELQQEITRSESWPQLSLEAEAKWQSEVTEFPVANPAFPSPDLSKDHYKLGLNVQQRFTQLYRNQWQEALDQVGSDLKKRQTEVSLYEMQSQVDHLFFGILLQQKRAQSTQLLIDELEQQLKLTNVRIEQGVVLPGAKYPLQAELWKAKQQIDEIHSRANSYRAMMVALTGNDQWRESELKVPDLEAAVLMERVGNRPEYAVFEQQRKQLDLQTKLTETKKWPELNAYGTAAYGRPGFDVFNDDIHGFLMVGIQARWNFWSVRNTNKQQKVLDQQKRILIQQEAAFDQQVDSQREEIVGQIKTAQQQIAKDDRIIRLRQKITDQAQDQLSQGMITTSDYITELREEHQARLQRNLHQVQLQWALATYATKMGIVWYE
jgi:outer membrane protein TolC